MSFHSQIAILIFVFSILIFIFELLRRRKISEAVTLWWISIGLIIILLTFSKRLLLYLTLFLGLSLPMTTLVLLSFFFVLLMMIYFSMKISILSYQVKELAQYIALLKNEYDLKNNDFKNNDRN
ncbi:hypothetical protein A2230_08130 [candidate division WOR-1 bacterium RIFOXYA2_FULL_36_21]|uniref:DUF2304 domain-containing protein n=1 Tax=candidate division WOR-1 bacterium RIFOXYB2_FULL_36_35 TaxID=1802578 RepID=A0A1F4S885_UNCSA|nr:MAG: hypothetical protein A2230_08130 [candidate division WOR-1 bacterium RIFOXYA2_FULL_36_21]OGC14609.1 MAG: hypothetical protein A2282_04145 [candidate division WOR-1 bacterium RIFOXYA12_FULL_36_13]OGC16624.1 MAG: hypothetical protein A2290_03345 [candidate division WOR-1 bacterium RIFOXYB2_FULL_36_35]